MSIAPRLVIKYKNTKLFLHSAKLYTILVKAFSQLNGSRCTVNWFSL